MNRILECAVEAGAKHIISGDRHLLALRQHEGATIVSLGVPERVEIVTVAESATTEPRAAIQGDSWQSRPDAAPPFAAISLLLSLLTASFSAAPVLTQIREWRSPRNSVHTVEA
jgi:hypothetical protein